MTSLLDDVTSLLQGDYGGPILCGDIVTGITSWGITSCSGEYPSVATRVSYYHSWLVGEAGSQ